MIVRENENAFGGRFFYRNEIAGVDDAPVVNNVGEEVTPEVTPDVTAEQGTANPENPVKEEETFDWSKDPRFKDFWKEDANNMYRDLKGYDRKYTPLNSTLKKYELDGNDALSERLEDYKTLIDPESTNNVIVNELTDWMGDVELAPQVQEAFEKFRGVVTQRKASEMLGYPVGTEQLTPQMVKLMEDFDTLKGQVDQTEKAKLSEQQSQHLDSELDKISKVAQKYGLEDYNEEAFIEEAMKSNLSPDALYSHFMENSLEKIAARTSEDASLKTANALKKKKAGGVTQSGNDAPAQKSAVEGLQGEFNNALKGFTDKMK